MQKHVNFFVFIYRAQKKALNAFYRLLDKLHVALILQGNNVSVGKGMKSFGIPVIDVSLGGKCVIGNNFKMNNGDRYNPIGRQQPCYLIVINKACLSIGDNVGISGTAIVCHKKISIGNNVKIGGNVVIYDTDFHSLDKLQRRNRREDIVNTKCLPVIIEDDVFVGAHTIILKGVSIGEGSVIGSGSVITKSVPPNEIWGGNPAKFIRTIKHKHQEPNKILERT